MNKYKIVQKRTDDPTHIGILQFEHPEKDWRTLFDIMCEDMGERDRWTFKEDNVVFFVPKIACIKPFELKMDRRVI